MSTTNYIKYPRTYHLPWSPGVGSDDRVVKDLSTILGREVIATEKLDGENTTMYRDHIHARSIDSGNHLSRNWAKAFHSQICRDIPQGWRVCTENVYAKHSIHYTNLESYVYGFSVWTDANECLSWDDTLEWFTLLNIQPVPTLYRGVFDQEKLEKAYIQRSKQHECEGYVVRVVGSFHFDLFHQSVMKYVRAHHVQTSKHWLHETVVPNLLKEKNDNAVDVRASSL